MDRKIKIVALNKHSGSKYHRLLTPLTLLSQLFPEKYEIRLYEEKHFIEEVAKDADILYTHWTNLTRCEILSIWRQKYGFKIIQDIDDYWELPQGHPSKDVVSKMIPQLLNQIILADVVLCSTPELKTKLLYYNPEVVVRANFLPLNTDLEDFKQFQIVNRDFFRNTKLNIGICGSVSHLPDWLSVLESVKRLKNDTFIQDNVNFVVSGYSDNNDITKKTWDRICNIFTYARQDKKQILRIDPLRIGFNHCFDYMRNYEPIDVLLCPLEINDFNSCKSNLKILESGLNGSIAVTNNSMYSNKINPNCYIESQDWYKDIKALVYLWKRNPQAFLEKARQIQFETLNENKKLYDDNIKTLDDVITAVHSGVDVISASKL